MQYTGGRDIEHPGAIDRRGRAVGPGADGHPDRPRQGQPLVRHCQGHRASHQCGGAGRAGADPDQAGRPHQDR
nr:MAG TPA: hypothetical protein [Caudoviricetes sp.]